MLRYLDILIFGNRYSFRNGKNAHPFVMSGATNSFFDQARDRSYRKSKVVRPWDVEKKNNVPVTRKGSCGEGSSSGCAMGGSGPWRHHAPDSSGASLPECAHAFSGCQRASGILGRAAHEIGRTVYVCLYDPAGRELGVGVRPVTSPSVTHVMFPLLVPGGQKGELPVRTRPIDVWRRFLKA